jgi:hypothetical protein
MFPADLIHMCASLRFPLPSLPQLVIAFSLHLHTFPLPTCLHQLRLLLELLTFKVQVQVQVQFGSSKMSSPRRSYKTIEVKYNQIPRSSSPADISGSQSRSGSGFVFAIDVRTPQELSRIQKILYKSQERTALIALAVDIDEEEELAKQQAKKLDEIEAAVENAKAEVESCQKKHDESVEANRPNKEKVCSPISFFCK